MRRINIALIILLMLLLFIVACDNEPIALIEEISIDSTTLNEFYIVDNGLNIDQLRLNINYSDGRVEPININSSMLTGFDPEVIGEQTVTVTYNGKKAYFTVQVVPSSFNVRYIAGANGTINGNLNQTIDFGGDALSVRAIPDEGYVFAGWSDGSNNVRRTDRAIYSDLTLTANFELATYRVRYHNRNGDVIHTENITAGQPATPPVDGLDQVGFVFQGWRTRSDNRAVDFDSINSNLDVIATYTNEEVRAIFYDVDDTMLLDTTLYYGNNVTPPSYVSTLYGYDFSHWVIKGSNTTATFNNITSDISYEPFFTPIQFQVTFNSSGGSVVAPVNVTYLDTIDSVPIPTREGMTFEGWYTSSDVLFDTNYVVQEQITVSAKWSIMKCTVYFYNTGNSYIVPVVVDYGAKVNPPTSPTRVGHTFNNWFTSETGGTVFNFNSIIRSATTVIYAQWIKNIYTVGFVTYGGTSVNNINVEYQGTINEPLSSRVGYNLLGWTRNTSTNALFDFNTEITNNMTLYAIWQEDIITVQATSNEGGIVNPNGIIEVGYNSSVTVSITPNSGYIIKTMTINGVGITIANTYTLNRSFHTLNVVFEKISYSITAIIRTQGGTVTPSGAQSYYHGTNATYNFLPNEGYRIDLIRINGVNCGAITSYTFNSISANSTIDVYFSLITYTVTASATTGGTITPQGTVIVGYGSSRTYTITPGENYHIANVRVNGVYQELNEDVKESMSVTINNITSNTTISATFEGDTYQITATSGSNGGISPSGTISESFGTSIHFTMQPDLGYRVASITVNGVNVGNSNQYTFSTSVLSSSNTINVEYELDEYNINWSLIGSGTINMIGSSPVTHGDSRVFEMTPNANHHLAILQFAMGNANYSVQEGEDNDGYSFFKNDNTYTLTIKSATGAINISVVYNIDRYDLYLNPGVHGIIVVNQNTNIISPTTMSIPYGNSVMLTIMPNSGYHISSIERNGAPINDYNASTHTLSINMTSDQSLSVEYDVNAYLISINITGNGSVFYNGDSVTSFYANHGSKPSITLSPDTGHHVKTLVVNSNNITVPQSLVYELSALTNSVIINVNFTINMFAIASRERANGIIEWPSEYNTQRIGDIDYLYAPYNDSIEYLITPNNNYHIDFVKVKVAGGSFITLNDGYQDDYWQYNIADGIGVLVAKNVMESRELDIQFSKDKFIITSSVDGDGGTISPIGDNTVVFGGNISFFIYASSGYYLTSIIIDGIEIDIELETIYTFIEVTSNHTIVFKFQSA